MSNQINCDQMSANCSETIENPLKIDKICGVCGAKAIGRNFGGITCESCKAFFRRSTLTTKDFKFKCHSNNKCIISKTNTKCKKCRLDKCYAIGMRKEYVTKLKKDQYLGTVWPQTQFGTTDTNSDLVLNTNLCFDSLFNNPIDKSSEIENSVIGLKNKSPDKESAVAIVRPMATFNKPLNDAELTRLSELSSAAYWLKSYGILSADKYCIEVNHLGDFYEKVSPLNIFDKYIENTVNFCRGISAFNNVCEHDQIIMVKCACWKIITLKHLPTLYKEYWSYDLDDQYSIKYNLNMMKNEQFDWFHKFFDRLPKSWIIDPNLVNLLLAIVLFDSDLDLQHKYAIKLNRQMYLYLMQRYLVQRFRSEDKSSESLSRILKCLMELQNLYVLTVDTIRQFSRFHTPLVKEVFDCDN